MVKSTSCTVLAIGCVFCVCVSAQNADVAIALQEILRLDQLMNLIQLFANSQGVTGRNPTWVIDEIASGILMNLASLQVRLISQRNGPQGEMIDKTLSRIEEKSYQLKTMLIQLVQDKSIPVTYFPKEGADREGQMMRGYRSKPNPTLLQPFG